MLKLFVTMMLVFNPVFLRCEIGGAYESACRVTTFLISAPTEDRFFYLTMSREYRDMREEIDQIIEEYEEKEAYLFKVMLSKLQRCVEPYDPCEDYFRSECE